eukprot:CAMPEP_0194372544 /NCGR_PEP_ID=MMETSP0174-20130528/20931_1 /TAXON_ID=216777 /ORGANISM="Proboscia alata, Strain PI-D3" /LENGTH=113 /DNA_ID=CAMNT_0039151147 /DNA_START=426 /DNA_END=767 /DNA_ORIENTATION=-
MSSILSGPMNVVKKVTDDTKFLFQSQPKMTKRSDQYKEDLDHFEMMLSIMNLGPGICDKISKINLAPVNSLMEAQEEAKNETVSKSKSTIRIASMTSIRHPTNCLKRKKRRRK